MAARTITSLRTEDHILPSCDGESSLFVRHFLQGTPRLHFLIVHGAIEHSGRHMELVNFWLRHYTDVAVTVFDGLGHGRSGGPRCYLSQFRLYVDDLLKVGELVQKKNVEETKTFICAHSLGGLITLTRILDSTQGWPFPTHGLIFSSPCIKPKVMFRGFSEALLEKLDGIVPKLHLPTLYGGAHFTRDPDRANDFDTDPLISKFITVRMAKEIIEASARIRGLSYYLKIPSLFLIAGTDCLVDPESTLLFAQGIDKRLVEVVQYPDHYHELWNELDRHEIFLSMKGWVERQLKERP